MRVFGLDLAWGKKATSGGCVLDVQKTSAKLIDVQDALGDDDAILSWFDSFDKDKASCLVAIDAPLIVPNWTGKRPCETELGRRFAKFQAGAHPANRTIFHDDVRGERLVSRFAERAVVQNPFFDLAHQSNLRRVFEVFPHPAHIVLFGLTRTLKYKAKPGRDLASRVAVLDDYARHLRRLALELNVTLPADFPRASSDGLTGGAFKRYEDSLDALSCAFVALWCWRHGPAGTEIFGDLTNGYVVVPRRPKMPDKNA